jgi:hypothetical protein
MSARIRLAARSSSAGDSIFVTTRRCLFKRVAAAAAKVAFVPAQVTESFAEFSMAMTRRPTRLPDGCRYGDDGALGSRSEP